MNDTTIQRLESFSDQDLKDINALVLQLSSRGYQMTKEHFDKVIGNKNNHMMVLRDNTKIVGIGSLMVLPQITGLKSYIEDVVVGLDEIINGGKYGTVRFASFYIKKLTNANVMPASKENENIKETKNDEEIIESENGNVLNEESQEEVITINLAGGGKEKVMLMETQTLKEATDLTIFQKMINWFKRLF